MKKVKCKMKTLEKIKEEFGTNSLVEFIPTSRGLKIYFPASVLKSCNAVDTIVEDMIQYLGKTLELQEMPFEARGTLGIKYRGIGYNWYKEWIEYIEGDFPLLEEKDFLL